RNSTRFAAPYPARGLPYERFKLNLTVSPRITRGRGGWLGLVTFLYPTRLTSDARWRAGVRLALGPLRQWVSLAPRPPFHPTRTAAGAAPRARLDKDGSPWRRSPLVSTYRRTTSMLPCVQVVSVLSSRVLALDWTTS